MSAPLKKPETRAGVERSARRARRNSRRPLGVDGVYGRTGAYETIVGKLDAYISRARDPRAEVLRFPPVMSRRDLEKNGYLKSFPNLLGCVCALHGSEVDIRAAAERADGNWTERPVARGSRPDARRLLSALSDCRGARTDAAGRGLFRCCRGLFPA